MYELTFSVENSNENLLKYMYYGLEASVDKVGGVCKYIHGQRRSKFALACDDLYAATIKRQSEDYLADVLTLGFKNLYLRKSLNVKDGLLINTLVNTLCVFDNKFDRHYIKKSLSLFGEICIDGYYNFRMSRLKSKWNELIEVVKGNGALLADSVVIKEFLCYLMDFLPSLQKDVSVVMDDGKLKLFDDKGRLVPNINIVSPATMEELVAINIIAIKPQSVRLYCNKQDIDAQLIDLLKYLFDVKISKVK